MLAFVRFFVPKRTTYVTDHSVQFGRRGCTMDSFSFGSFWETMLPAMHCFLHNAFHVSAWYLAVAQHYADARYLRRNPSCQTNVNFSADTVRKHALLSVVIMYRNFNIVDTMMEKLDAYATNLQKKISERTRELEEERLKSDLLLYSVMPPWVLWWFSLIVYNQVASLVSHAETKSKI